MYIDDTVIVDYEMDKIDILKADGNVTYTPIYKKNTITINPIDYSQWTGVKSHVSFEVGYTSNDTSLLSIDSTTTQPIVMDLSFNQNEIWFKLVINALALQLNWGINLDGTSLFNKGTYQRLTDIEYYVGYQISYIANPVFTPIVADYNTTSRTTTQSNNIDILNLEGYTSKDIIETPIKSDIFYKFAKK